MLRKKTGFISSISTFYRGLRAQSDMKHLLLLSLDAENLSASAEWKQKSISPNAEQPDIRFAPQTTRVYS